MKKPWYRKDPAHLARLIERIEAAYPTLHVSDEENRVALRGAFPVQDQGKNLDWFKIEIELPTDRSDGIPVLRETGGRVPHHPDRHVNLDGTACPFLLEERWRIYPGGSTLLDYLRGPVHNFFLGQALVEAGEPWPFGEHRHGTQGIIDYYVELVGTSDTGTVVRYLEALCKPTLKGHEDCPCGSGKRLRNCHRATLLDLRTKIPPGTAKQSLEKILAKGNLS